MQYPKIPLHGALIGFFAAFILLYSARSIGQAVPLKAQVAIPEASSSSADDRLWNGGDVGLNGNTPSTSSVSSDSSGAFATCSGYDQVYRVDMTVPENETHFHVWARQFDQDFAPIREQLNGLQNGIDCSQALRTANEQFSRLVLKYRCALSDETLTEFGALAALSRQDWAKDPEGTINIMKLMTYMNETQIQLQQANTVTNSAERYVQSFRCDVNVTLPPNLTITVQGGSSSSPSSSPSDEDESPPPEEEQPPDEDSLWDWNTDTGGDLSDQPPVDDAGGW